jgi:ABC-type transport system involved in multi-copper enzyme maturation permease subunit
MTIVPVIERELRAQARLPFTYGLRVLSGALVLVVALGFSLHYGLNYRLGLSTLYGGEALFSYLTFTLFCSIWVIVPLMAADCISREQREGTLGLLFLTSLKSGEIVLAKGLAHWLRAMTLWLAVLPVLMVPFLMGGVSWKEGVMLLLTSFSCICWALAAGLLASAACKSGLRSLLSAMILGTFFFLGFLYLEGVSIREAMSLGHVWPASASIWSWYITPPRIWPGHPVVKPGFAEIARLAFPAGFLGATDTFGCWSDFFNAFPARAHALMLAAVGVVALVSAAVLAGAVAFAALRLRRVWQEEPAPVWVLRWEKTLCQPILWVSFFRRWMRYKLEHNPIGWLETRTWTGRMVSWGWFGVTVSLYSLAFSDPNNIYALRMIQKWMAWLLLGSMALSAAGSFRRERETGMLELLLVSPLTEGQIIGGRLRGLWSQFLPALVLLLGVWGYSLQLFTTGEESGQMFSIVVSYAVLPVIGLYFSLHGTNFIGAFLRTIIYGFALPEILLGVATALSEAGGLAGAQIPGTAFVAFVQLCVAGVLGWRLYRDLARRSFPLHRAIM